MDDFLLYLKDIIIQEFKFALVGFRSVFINHTSDEKVLGIDDTAPLEVTIKLSNFVLWFQSDLASILQSDLIDIPSTIQYLMNVMKEIKSLSDIFRFDLLCSFIRFKLSIKYNTT